MRKLVASCLFALAALVTVSDAAERSLVRPLGLIPASGALLGNIDLPMPAPLHPVPEEIQYSGPVTSLPVMPATATLYHNVRVRDERNIAPCAKPIIVQVPDPCACKDACNPAPCVNVQICVPECGCPRVKVTRCGNKVRYDYGKYAVDIVSAHGRVVVDYDR